MPQYLKLRKKAQAGARFVINQIGWDVRKDDELLRWIRREGLWLRALANVYLLSRGRGARVSRGQDPGRGRDRRAARARGAARREPGPGRAFFVDLAARHVAVARGLGFDGVYLGGHVSAETFGEILDRAGSFARRRLEGARARDPVPAPGRVPLLRARPGDRALVRRRERGVPRVEATPANRPAGAAEVPVQPAPPRRRLRGRGAAAPRRTVVLPGRREGSPAAAQGRARARAGREGAALRLPRLRRLLAPRDRIRLPRVPVREEPAQRPVRRHPRRPLRGLRHGVHLVAGLRAAQGLRRGGDDARRPGRDQGQRARAGRARGRTRSSAATITAETTRELRCPAAVSRRVAPHSGASVAAEMPQTL